MTQTLTKHIKSSSLVSSPAPLDHVLALLSQSDIHRKFTVDQVNRCIIPPVNLRQNVGIFDDGVLVAWCSWLFTTRDKADTFLEGEYKFQPHDWSSGNVLVMMDFVAPFGHTRTLYRMCRALFPDYPKAEWRRHAKKRRVGVNLNVE